MIYVMSDLHGCYDRYKKMLELIGLNENDMLYILGDIVDRGPDGIKILLELIDRKNIIALRGNHDHEAGVMFRRLRKPKGTMARKEFDKQFGFWVRDGAWPTYESFLELGEEEKTAVINYLRKMPFYKTIEVGGQKYFLAHTVPEKECMPQKPEQCSAREFIWGEPDYEETYFEDITIVTGHTPTVLIDKDYEGRIWKGNNHIVVDCGAVFSNSLGCICLDTGEEFYVE